MRKRITRATSRARCNPQRGSPRGGGEARRCMTGSPARVPGSRPCTCRRHLFLPTKTDKLPSGSQWLHEIKHDGFRIIARKTGAQVRLYSRPGNDLTRRFPLIVETLARLRSRSCIIDGEAEPLGEKNRPPKGKGRPEARKLDKGWVPSLSGGSMTANHLEHEIATFPGSPGAGSGRQEAHSMRATAQVTAPGAVTSIIVAVSTSPNRQNRSTRSRMSVPLVQKRKLRLVNRIN